MGLKVIDSDSAFERKLKKEKITLDFATHNDIEIVRRDIIRSKSKQLQVCN